MSDPALTDWLGVSRPRRRPRLVPPVDETALMEVACDPRLSLVTRWLALRHGGPRFLAIATGVDEQQVEAIVAARPHSLDETHQLRLCELCLAIGGRPVPWGHEMKEER